MDFTLELIVVPVTDIDASKAFYEEKCGFHVDVDFSNGPDFRVVQLTPPGSACSISLMKAGDDSGTAGQLRGLHLCVSDIVAAREELAQRGLEISEPFHFGAEGRQDGVHPDRVSYGTFATFTDPDGSVWLVQEVRRGAGAPA
ncbi:VOC family protein [Spongisporangium articulatum]|uniref:VOC family protein n=1 Tax=Spongisporangium articulatum TaxID=3362603 RepID=A0ABW8ALD0_9ACTN